MEYEIYESSWHLFSLLPTRQDVHGRGTDALLWARMKIFRTFSGTDA